MKPSSKLYQLIAAEIARLNYCLEMADIQPHHADNAEDARKRLTIMQDELPSGSGIDCGTEIDLDESSGKKIVLSLSYHHMNDGGMYDGWTDHKVILEPSFSGYDIRVTGRDRNQIKEYLADTFAHALDTEYYWFGHDLRHAEKPVAV